MFDPISTASSIIGGLYQNHSAGIQAEWARDWEKMMSDTAHRREVADLEAAGLNPILSVNKGASTPSTSMAPVSDPVTPALNVGLAAKQNKAAVEQMEQNTINLKKTNEGIDLQNDNIALQNRILAISMGKIENEVDQIEAATNLTRAQKDKAKQEIKNLMEENPRIRHSARETAASADIRESQVPGAKTEGEIDSSFVGRILRGIKRVRDSLGIGNTNSTTIEHNYGGKKK